MIWNPFNKPPKNKTKEATKDIRIFAVAFLSALGACEKVEANDRLPEKSTPVEWVDFLAKRSSVEGDNFESHITSLCNIENMDCTTIASKSDGSYVGSDLIRKNIDTVLEKYKKIEDGREKSFIVFVAHNHPYQVVDRLRDEFDNIKFPERVLAGPSGSGDCLVPTGFMPAIKSVPSKEIALVVDPAGLWVCSSTNYRDSVSRPLAKQLVKIRTDLFIASQSKQGKELEEAIKTFESEFYRLLKVKVKFMNFGFTNQELVDTTLEVLK